MNRNDYTFDINDDTDRPVGFEPLPMGRYHVAISDAQLRDTKREDGLYLKVRFDVVEGAYTRRVVFENFNVENPSPEARSIGRAQLMQLLRAIGVTGNARLSDPMWIKQNMLDKQCLVQLTIERQPGFDPQNRVKAFFPVGVADNAAQPTLNLPPTPHPQTDVIQQAHAEPRISQTANPNDQDWARS